MEDAIAKADRIFRKVYRRVYEELIDKKNPKIARNIAFKAASKARQRYLEKIGYRERRNIALLEELC